MSLIRHMVVLNRHRGELSPDECEECAASIALAEADGAIEDEEEKHGSQEG